MSMFRPLIRVFRPWKWSLREVNLVVFSTITLLANITLTLGFSDLRSFSLCLVESVLTVPIAVGIGAGLMSVMSIAVGLVGLRHYVEWKVIRVPMSSDRSGIDSGEDMHEKRQTETYFI
jgi:hypothetical protein